MTKAEFTLLNSGDVVENKYGQRKTVTEGKWTSEPITQIARSYLIGQYAHWKIVMKVKKNEHGSNS